MNEKATPSRADAPDAVKPVLAAAREQLSRLRGGALLIGVEDYRAYDGTGGKDLPAGRNDVLAYWKVCRRLGFTHIRALTSPVLTEDDLVRAELELVPELSPGETADQVRARVKRWLSKEEPAAPRLEGETAEEVAGAVQRWVSSLQQEPGDLTVSLREATSAAMKEGVRWLSKGLVFAVKLSWGDWQLQEEWASLPGIMTYSGHGAQQDGDLALCPTDTGPALQNAVSFSELRGIFDEVDRIPGGKHPTDNLTILLDCCFAAASDPAGKAQRGTSLGAGGASPGKVPVAKKEIGSRVFCASGRDEQSYQAMLGGHWHGAFTWAVTVALEQWQIKEEGQFKRSTMSHAELLFRARMLLQALSFRQHPILVDELGNLPVFHHGSADGAEASERPDAKRPGVQIDPSGDHDFTIYNIYDKLAPDAQLFATLVVVRANISVGDFQWSTNTEYWKVYRAFDTSTMTSLNLERKGSKSPPWNNPNDSDFTFPRSGAWTDTNETPDLSDVKFGLTAKVTTSPVTARIKWHHDQKYNVFQGVSVSPGIQSVDYNLGREGLALRYSALNTYP
jgi:hypothetical protein